MSQGKVTHGAALDAVFALTLLLFFFLFTGLRYAFRIPVDVRANWIFRLTVPDAFAERARTLRILYIGLTILPAVAATSPFLCVALGILESSVWSGVCCALDERKTDLLLASLGLVALWLVEYEIQESDIVPLTCSYLPGKKNILHTGLIYWLLVFLLTSVVTALEAIGGRNPIRAVLVLTMLTLIAWRIRTREQILMPKLRFDDLPEPAVATLGLGGE